MSYELGNIRRIGGPGLGENRRQQLQRQIEMAKCGKPSCQGGILSQIGKALLIPAAVVGVTFGGPFIAKGIVGAGKLARKAAPGAGKLIGRVAAAPSPSGFVGPPIPPEVMATAPSNGGGGGATSPGFSPVPSVPSEPSVEPLTDAGVPQAAGVGAPKAGLLPLAIIAGLLLVFAKPQHSPRRA